VGQDPDPLRRNGGPADGAPDTIQEGTELVARIHARISLAERLRCVLSEIPPGSMISRTALTGATTRGTTSR
jgi:hypothetical protein